MEGRWGGVGEVGWLVWKEGGVVGVEGRWGGWCGGKVGWGVWREGGVRRGGKVGWGVEGRWGGVWREGGVGCGGKMGGVWREGGCEEACIYVQQDIKWALHTSLREV